MVASRTRSERVRAQLDHPVIDGDGHWLEPIPIYLDYLRDEGGPQLVDTFRKFVGARGDWYRATPQERIERRLQRPGWWQEPPDTRDRATASLPRLLNERLAEFGIDFAILYPSLGLVMRRLANEELRRLGTRALNRMTADLFRPYASRIAPAAAIPIHTPEEAIEEVEFAVRELGMKAILISGYVMRQTANGKSYVDAVGLDSPYDYDPFWAKCVELKVAVTTHLGSRDWPDRQSITNFTFNHVGHFASSGHFSARAIFLGGVTRRFPTLNFGFLEGGIGWACNLLLDLVSHFEKRNIDVLQRRYRPTNLDLSRLATLYEQYAEGSMRGRFDEFVQCLNPFEPFVGPETLASRERDAMDDWAAAGIESVEQLRERFRSRFYFGCEADDPMTAIAFDTRLDTRLRPIFSSDIGHFDVPDMPDVLHEAWELVERGLIGEQDFREFTFTNIVRLHGEGNPDFFKGTAVEAAAASVLAGE